MKTLIVHIEFEGDVVDLEDRLCTALEDFRDAQPTRDVGWRFFDSLEDADRWETGEELQWHEDSGDVLS